MTSLAARFPAIAQEWHPTKNRYLQPDSVMAGSGRKVWWQCRKDPAHVWRATINNRTHPHQRTGCPFCAHQRVSATTSLEARFPAVAAEWHPTKNGKLTPAAVMPGSIKKAWWRCAHNRAHEWEAGVSSRTRGTGCPHCYRDSRKPRALRGTARAVPDPVRR
jgi:Probable Zinc-ribbon domain